MLTTHEVELDEREFRFIISFTQQTTLNHSRQQVLSHIIRFIKFS